LTDLEANLEALDGSFTSGTAVIGDAADLTGATAPALRNFITTLRQLQTVGIQVDSLLTTVSHLPLAPSYDSRNGLGPTFGHLADTLAPLPDKFDATSRSLADLETSSADLQTRIAILARSIHDVNQGLDGTRSLLADYRTNLNEARLVAEGSRHDLRRDRTLVRALILVAGLNFAAVQLAPLWLGYQLLDEEHPDELQPSALAADGEPPVPLTAEGA
jgi:hypothetical protein